MSGYMWVKGRCPACGSTGLLFVGAGGYITCSLDSCPDPGAATDLLESGRPKVDDPVCRCGQPKSIHGNIDFIPARTGRSDG